MIAVQGSTQTRTYTDKDNIKRKAFEIIADYIHSVASKGKNKEETEIKKDKTIPAKESNDTEPMEESSHGRW